jgi:peptidoglycan/LPS O-acetylase OafA/YrhL
LRQPCLRLSNWRLQCISSCELAFVQFDRDDHVWKLAMSAAQPGFVNQKNASAGEAHRFLALDGLRGVAAFAVILDHVSSTTLRAWLPGRYMAVDFFFVLSGFVLAHAYGARLASGMSPLEFMRVRLIRLYPLYLLGLALGLVVPIVASLRGWNEASPLSQIPVIALFGLFFLPAPPLYSWTGQHLYPFNGPAWSLFFELAANLVYGLVARFLSWRVFAVILPVGAALTTFTVMRHDSVGGPGWLWPHLDAGLARVLYCFFAGVAIYRLRGVIKLPAMPAWTAVLALFAIFWVPAQGEWRPAYDAFAAIVLMPLVVAFASGAKVNGKVAQVCAVLGLLSYGVYALHVPLMVLTEVTLATLHIDLPFGVLEVFLVAVVAASAAALADHFYDGPVRRWLNKRAKGKVAQVPTREVS